MTRMRRDWPSVGGISDAKFGVIVILCAFNYLAGDVHCRPDSENVSRNKNGGTHRESTIPSPSRFISTELVNLPEYIHASLQNYCDACTPSQRKKLEQVLLHILSNLSEDTSTPQQYSEALLKTLSKMSYSSKKFKATSSPKSVKLVNLPTPEYQYYSRQRHDAQQRVIALPTISTTPSSAVLHSSTVSSPPDPVQSVEMPTPPMPPTTTLPIYFYYLSSSSKQPPTTPVVESSVGSKPTTVMP